MSLTDTSPTANSEEVKNGSSLSGSQNGSSYNSSSGYGMMNGCYRASGNRGCGGGRNRGREGFRFQNNNRPTCQICSKYGHSAVVCYFRADMKYMGSHSGPSVQSLSQKPFTTPSPMHNFVFSATESIPDSSWYMDSGASSHVTSYPS
ncbi:hypothetical protein Scep_022164 [Stephania cephalantha]|uniref:Uncharacterized protein n=1 Tax=Stephania cephalantha TaxID=152367 RepID=A0AAP0F7F2_9MAGN